MKAPQRGSVLLTVIAGLVLLALLGSAMVTLMTGSVMTGVDGKEAVQATYLAESGKEIVRVQTEKLSGEDIMNKAIALEKKGPISIDGKGDVKLQFFPSWFRWTGEELKSTDSKWYGGAPTGSHEWLAISENGAMRYLIDDIGNIPKDAFGTKAADIYLIGRVSEDITYDAANKTLTVKTTENDLDYFPDSGGLIGLVSQRTEEGSPPITVQVNTHRFTYDKKELEKGNYKFTNVTRLSSSPLSTDTFMDKDIVLGQYFRVVSEGQTANGARAAQVWHTNGRNSLKYGSNSDTGKENTTNIISGNLDNTNDIKSLFGQHVTEHNKNNGYTVSQYGQSLKAISIQGFRPSMPNHFLLKTSKKTSTDYWFAGITDDTIPFEQFLKDNGVMVQVSTMIHPPEDEKAKRSFFAGILFRTKFLQGNKSAALTPHGVSGLGMGIVYGSIEFDDEPEEIYYKVDECTINPALLPGFEWISEGSSNPEDPEGYFRIKKTDWDTYSNIFIKGTPSVTKKNIIKPTLILWAYDDSITDKKQVYEPPYSLRCLAAASLNSSDVYTPDSSSINNFYFTRIVAQIREQGNFNKIRAWIASQRPPCYGIITSHTLIDPETNNFPYEYNPEEVSKLGKVLDEIRNGFKISEGALWPTLDFVNGVAPLLSIDRFTLITWQYINPDALFAGFETEKADGSNVKTIVTVPFATGAEYNRAGIFQGAYTEDDDEIPNTYNLNFRNFAVGIPNSNGVEDDSSSGLTPGIVQ